MSVLGCAVILLAVLQVLILYFVGCLTMDLIRLEHKLDIASGDHAATQPKVTYAEGGGHD